MAEQVSDQLEQAEIILLLVSSDFLASEYCYDVEMPRALEMHDSQRARVVPIIARSVEMPRALEMHDSQRARVVPIIARSVDWHGTPFHRLQALPKNGKAVADWPNRDQAWKDVAHNLRDMIDEWQKKT